MSAGSRGGTGASIAANGGLGRVVRGSGAVARERDAVGEPVKVLGLAGRLGTDDVGVDEEERILALDVSSLYWTMLGPSGIYGRILLTEASKPSPPSTVISGLVPAVSWVTGWPMTTSLEPKEAARTASGAKDGKTPSRPASGC